eukprot:jgi/Ulvmu1/2948/UM149_0031.1
MRLLQSVSIPAFPCSGSADTSHVMATTVVVSLRPCARDHNLLTKRKTLACVSRRMALVAPSFLAVVDPRTLANSVLSGYGLPTVGNAKGFTPYDNFSSNYEFLYPKSWVARQNSQRPGVYIADFQTADKAVVEELSVPGDGDVISVVVAAAVAPGAGSTGGTDKLSLPPAKAIKVEEVELDGRRYTYLQFPSETITNSGYNIKRRNFAVASVKNNKVYALVASARSDQYNVDKATLLTTIVQSFRVR